RGFVVRARRAAGFNLASPAAPKMRGMFASAATSAFASLRLRAGGQGVAASEKTQANKNPAEAGFV
ncbi:hypothetical protein JTP77_043740, partial [Streptomyces sp. S9]|nr:hypothetical protein [Streptomyces sp. S9]